MRNPCSSCNHTKILWCLRSGGFGRFCRLTTLVVLFLGSVAWGIRLEDKVNTATSKADDSIRTQTEKIDAANAKIDHQLAECNAIVLECSKRLGGK